MKQKRVYDVQSRGSMVNRCVHKNGGVRGLSVEHVAKKMIYVLELAGKGEWVCTLATSESRGRRRNRTEH